MKNWKMERLKNRFVVPLLFLLGTVCLGSCWCINEDGLALLSFRDRIENDPFGALSSWNNGEIDPCSWSGVECSDGRVVALNLTDLCLEGTLAPEIGNIVHIKSITLRNNTFSGVVPHEIGKLKNLQVLDLGCNNFSGLLPYILENNSSLSTLLLDNNELLLTGLSKITPEFQVGGETQIISGKTASCAPRKLTQERGTIRQRMLLQQFVLPPPGPPPPEEVNPVDTTQPPPPPSDGSQNINKNPPPASSGSPPEKSPPSPSPPPALTAHPNAASDTTKKSKPTMVVAIAVGVSALLIFLIILCVYYRRNHISVIPWVTSFSGHLQKSFASEASPARISVPKLKRSELETACEDFSNVVGSSSIGTIYKGTLSSGAEIAVATVAVKSVNEWSTNLETQFKKKMERLSKVNHKNFVSLVGYCEEEEPFTRMMVFEYAPNGTLFEHLHVKDAEHLDWGMRLRIAMGVAYCLEHMHQLNPPYPHTNLNSSAIMLTEDYAAKVSNFIFWNQISAAEIETNKSGPVGLSAENSSAGLERNVYSFGVLLFEMVTARLPYSIDDGSSDDWASDYLRGDRPLRHMVDPSLTSFDVDQVEQIGHVVKFCVHPSPDHRPTMAEVCERLRVVTGILPDGAATKISSLWWAELEIISTEGV